VSSPLHQSEEGCGQAGEAVLLTRLITAAVGIPVIIGVIWVGGALLAAVTAVAVLIAALEISLARGVMKEPYSVFAALCAAAVPAVALAGGEYLLAALMAGVMLVSAALCFTPDLKANLQSWLWGVAGVLYFGGLASHFVLLREAPNGRDWLFFTVIAVWVTDTGAYFVGRAIGKHKMAPKVSPGKTWEGAVGSAIAGFAIVFALDAAFSLDMSVAERVALGLLLPPVVMLGDVAESAFKRALEIKDSSGLVPGHGGIADRLDSLLFAAPFVYYFVAWFVY
jgi:phosphatidate cytidylyltransferase